MANFVEWSDTLSVGIEEIDEQHKVLVELINRMHEAIHQRHGSDAVKGILVDLADYTRIHFAVEESLMRILNYPDYENHKAIHEELLQHVLELQEKVESGKTADVLKPTVGVAEPSSGSARRAGSGWSADSTNPPYLANPSVVLPRPRIRRYPTELRQWLHAYRPSDIRGWPAGTASNRR